MLEQNILIPVEKEFGKIHVSYGFTSLVLKNYLLRHFAGQMAPALDQHAASELNSKGNLICSRQGAAVDFIVEGYTQKMDIIAKFVIENLPFDRLYFYGHACSLHVSIGPEKRQSVQFMKQSARGYFVPFRRGKGRDSLKLFT